jgi:adenylate cyclase
MQGQHFLCGHSRLYRLPGVELRASGASEHHIEVATRDVLGTVNLYLSTIAEVIRAHAGTLDKYVGDAVMAFWGAPMPDERHAVASVKAAIAAQRAIGALNEQRQKENQRRLEASRAPDGAPPDLLPILTVGMAVNSGDAIAGFMGSASLMSNYTVFGREVNVASRLEGVAGSGHIVIADSTYRELQRFEPALAASCVAREPIVLRGISKPVRVYELPVQPTTEEVAHTAIVFGHA